jgi:hypothetical protein
MGGHGGLLISLCGARECANFSSLFSPLPLGTVYAEKKLQSLTFQTCFRPEDSQLLAQSLILCLAMSCASRKNIRVDTEKTSDLILQTWATYNSYVGQVHVRVRIKVRVARHPLNA